MKRWMSLLAVLFLLGGGAMLSACGPPDEIDEQELEDAMDDDMGGDDDW